MRYDMFGFTNRIPIFIIGILIGWLSQKSNPVFDRLTWKLLMLIFLLGLYLSYLSIYRGLYILVPESDCCFPNILMAVSLSFLFSGFLYVLNEKPHLKFLGKGLTRIFSFFGMFTLEFYCIQEWLGEKILARILVHYSNLTVNIVLFAAVTVTALIMHYVFRYFWMCMERAAKKLQAEYNMKKKNG